MNYYMVFLTQKAFLHIEQQMVTDLCHFKTINIMNMINIVHSAEVAHDTSASSTVHLLPLYSTHMYV